MPAPVIGAPMFLVSSPTLNARPLALFEPWLVEIIGDAARTSDR
ncbi:MAG TPA: hypothetical protein VF463_06140 [Sphingobium sp.]